ncbi:MAG: InlB B-repeat-containing protein, partial [Acholeplasma sp.]|nr:InlB B-repeat-containing protein [Acholeplasma sp.]
IDLEGNNDYTFDTMPANDLTLYAQWQINAYTITFDTGEGTTVDSITQDYQTALTKPADPTRLFYTFDGWYEDQEYTILYSFNLMEARDLILYAKWLPNEFMITLELNGGMGETTLIERYTLPIEAPHPEKEGYTFDGWFTDAALTNPYVFSTMPPQNFTLYAKWNINAYTITFESYGGTTYNPIIKIYNTSMPAIEDPIKEGYTFTGWFLDESFTDVYAYSNMPARNITLYARWHNSITFDSNGGSLVDTITLASGSTVNEPSDPIKLGHTFIGWYEDIDLTIPYVFSTMPEPNITIYAKWEVNQYIIGFEPNGGDYVETISQDFGTELILPIPVRTGYSFMGWYKDDELTQVVEFTTVQAANMVLYAKWEINQYSIYFKTNDVESVETITQDYGTEFELPTIAKEGHTFVGWYIDESMTQLVDFSTIQANDIVMYAKWEINNYYINYYDIKQDLLGLTLVYGEKIIDFTSGEQHFGVLTNFNRVIVWGLNSSGQLGIGNTISSEIPMDITNNFNLLENENIVFVKFSENTSSALTSSGRVFFWGSNSNGILGIGLLPSSETINTHSPIDISTSFNLSIDELVTSIYLGDNNASVITSNNRVFIWGSNEYGQLGNGTLIDQSSPIDITDRFNFIDDYPIHMSLGTFHSALVTHQGKVYLWGRNNAGQIGILAGTSSSSIKTPLDITTHFNLDEDDKIVKVSLGYFHSGVITLKGNVYTWGAGGNGQLGNGNLYHTHIKQNITEFFNLDNNEKIVNLELDYFHSSGFTSFGRIFVWGWNSYGQLGNSSGNIVSPYEISNIVNIGEVNKIASFSVEESTTAIITEFGKIYILGIYNINKGSYSPINVVNYQYQLIYTETYDYNQEIILYTPQNESLIFDGWYDDEELMSKFTDSNMSTSNILLYGFWKKYD